MRYKLAITIRYPKPDNKINFLDFYSYIMDAKDIFNHKNNTKSIESIDVKEDRIELILKSGTVIARPLKELSSFSRSLYPVMGEFSSVDKKLFKSISIVELESDVENNSLDTEENKSDQELIKAFKILVESKNIGSEQRILDKNKGLEDIRKIIMNLI